MKILNIHFKKFLFILILLLLAVFSNGQYAIPFALWVLMTLLLFAVRKMKRGLGFLFAFSVMSFGNYIGFDVIPFLPELVSIA
ncbi:MAG: hypothetical protein N4A46_11900, partial [Schleiferiaceae bacterium]|nr:hypothetical protein [Schleiferiaceae bacterium]